MMALCIRRSRNLYLSQCCTLTKHFIYAIIRVGLNSGGSMFSLVINKIKLFRLADEHSVIGGVCGGIAYQLHTPVWIVRIIVLLALFSAFIPYRIGGYVLVTYILLWAFVPTWDDDPEDFDEVTGGVKPTPAE
jgi:phage shock protein PspC (stress-responsive transcriptional regulator)